MVCQVVFDIGAHEPAILWHRREKQFVHVILLFLSYFHLPVHSAKRLLFVKDLRLHPLRDLVIIQLKPSVVVRWRAFPALVETAIKIVIWFSWIDDHFLEA